MGTHEEGARVEGKDNHASSSSPSSRDSQEDVKAAVSVLIPNMADSPVDEKLGGNKAQEAEGEEAAASKEPEVSAVSFFKLFSTADNLDKLTMVVALIAAVVNGALLPMFSLLFGQFTNAFGDPNPDTFMDTIKDLSLKFLYLGLGAGVAAFLDSSLWTWTGNRQANRLRGLYLASVLGQDIAFFDTSATGTGGMLQGLNQDSGDVQMGISEKLGQLIKAASTFVTGFILAFIKGWDMTLVMLGCIPLMGVMGAFMAKTISSSTQKQNVAYAKASATAQQSIAQIRTVAAYTQEPRMEKDYSAALAEPMQAGIRQAWVMGLTFGAFQIIIYGSFAVALVYGSFRVSTGAYTGGDVMNVLIAVLLGGFAIMQGAPNLQYIVKAKVSGARIFRLIDRRPVIEINAESGEEPLESGVVGELRLQNINFAYPARADVTIFTDFNLVVPAGKTMALVGSSGSGKSTVVGLIERFYDPIAGAVLLDGIDIRSLKLSWLRNQIGLVSQEPTLFATSVRENIAMGRPGATDAEIEAAAVAANAHVFIGRLPEGYSTHVGERGLQLSGGQKQRIAIARAVLKNPKILLLDEATSALDTQSERVVQAALERLAVGRTSVVVAHRLSTIRNADAISVLSGGRVIEQGGHEELIQNQEGAYFMLVQLQLQHKSGSEPAQHALAAGVEEVDDDEALAAQCAALAAQAAEAPGAKLTSKGSAETGSALGKGGKTASLELITVVPANGAGVVAPKLDPKEALKALEAEEAKTADTSFRRLARMNLPEWKYGVVGVIASGAAGATSPAFSFLFASMISIFYDTNPDTLKSKSSFYAGMMAVVGAGSCLALLCQQVSFGTMGQRLALRVRELLFKSILRQEIGWFDRETNNSGALSSLLSNDATYVRGAVADVIGLLIQNLTTLAFGYLLALIYDWRMALLVTGILPLLVLAQSVEVKFQMGTTSGADKLYAGANQAASESISAVRVVQSYNMQPAVMKRYVCAMEDTNKQVSKRAWAVGFSTGFAAFMMFATYSLVIYFGGNEIINGWTTFDHMLKAFMAILFAAMGMAQAAMGFGDVGKAKSAVQRIFPIVDRVPLIDATGDEGYAPPLTKVSGAVSFVDVGFTYPSRPDVPVFKGFSLEVTAGMTMALVGESGSGKSTVVGLIERFYDPQFGAVLLDGIDIRQYNLKWLRQQVGLVSQEPLLFGGSIMDNIRFGNTKATKEEVVAAAEAANARSFVECLPESYDTLVGEGGMQLSGGQKQRIAIARAIVKNPKILLLDEATSALDARSEAEVQVALDRIMVGRTSLVIAHRLSTIRHADCIAVVYRGVILEKGSHAELLALPDSSYARLVEAQSQK